MSDHAVISSHGFCYDDRLETFSLAEFEDGTTVHFFVPHGSLESSTIRQAVQGGLRPVSTHTSHATPVLYDYHLRKFQGARHGDANETYGSILAAIGAHRRVLGPRELRREESIRSDSNLSPLDKLGLIGDRIPRDVITIRSGGRFSKNTIRLSELIEQAQGLYGYKTFCCCFCREIL